MRIVFMGTPALAATILEELAQVHEVACVYTRPDAVRKRGTALEPSPVKVKAGELGIEVRTPKTLRDAEVQRELAALKPEAICVAAYGAILPREVLDIPPYGCLNVHASLLPRWRGAAPIQRAILAGDEEAGVCIMRMEEGLDTGDYCVSRRIPISGMSADELTCELADLGARALLTALEQVASGSAAWVVQGEEGVTYAEKLEKGELALSPELTVREAALRTLASDDAHPARCSIAGKGVRVLRAADPADASSALIRGTSSHAESCEGSTLRRGACERAQAAEAPVLEPGVATYEGKRLFLGCADGALEIAELKPDGKRAMAAVDFAAGNADVRGGSARWSA